MTDVMLSAADQAALRHLLAAEPVQGVPLPSHEVLEHLARLIPCDVIGLALVDHQGWVVDGIVLPRGRGGELHGSGCRGRVELGILQWPPVPAFREELRADGLADSLGAGFRHGRDGSALLWLDRRRREFSPRDVTLLSMIAPAVQRLVRGPGKGALPDLTLRERHALSLVAAGLSNPEIAERMGVATCTVRKHLEHSYRKLGVGNRLAATVALKDSREGE